MNPSSVVTIRELENRFIRGGESPSESDLALFEADPRAGARRIAAVLRRRNDRLMRERDRLDALLAHERSLWVKGISYVAGVDEVGVGPFAGPVVAAAVVFPKETVIEGVRDSKKLDHKRRTELDSAIRRKALSVGIGLVEAPEIDRINIFRAALEAMRLAILDLKMKIQHVLVDGRTIPGIGIPQDAIVGGDGKIFSIAAASIVAKVYRDNLMLSYDEQYPHYGFARHKGYGTAEHICALREHGPCEIHRRSFTSKR
ncbi:MAG: ribonuclease HII [bacterium]